ncbi:hypothetical protein ACFOLF_27970 [Paenibacillus sepulcri]|uniref:hypothetical protein n=1 Tax=Paenibacillus sepulcri TaxID=359917 RepID=UPI001AE8D4E0
MAEQPDNGKQELPGDEQATAMERSLEDEAKKRRSRTPGSLHAGDEPGEEPPQSADEAEEQIGPAEASPHWKSFYRSVSRAVADMRPKP